MKEELSRREIDCLRLVRLPNGEIAARLNLSVKTVEHALSSACRKLGARNRTDAVLKALGQVFLQPEDFWGRED